MPDVPPATNLEPMDMTGRPSWISGFDLRFVEGEIQLDRSVGGDIRSARSVLWLGDAQARPLDFISLTALSDIFFVRILQVRGYMVPVSTVTMTTYFHADEAELAEIGSEHVLGTADAKTFNNNFADQQAEIWSLEGKLLATCYQTSYFRE
jgi:acyl-CoA thioesterase